MSKTLRMNFIRMCVSVSGLLPCAALLADPARIQDTTAKLAVVASDKDPIDVADKFVWKIREAHPAVERARRIVGMRELRASQARAELTVIKDDLTAYLREQIINRPLWRVTISDWSVKVPSFPEVRDQFVRTLDVYIDPVDGKLLKLETRWPEGEPHLIGPRPTAEVAVQQMRRGGERHHGFPSDPPGVSFLDALDDAIARGGAKPFVARQIFGHYVIQSEGLHEPAPVWSITLWGIPPYYLGGRAETNDPVFVLRYIVDARTGRWRSSITNPYWTERGDERD